MGKYEAWHYRPGHAEVLLFSRDSVSDPYSAELKGSPRFGSVSTTYKTVLSQDEEARQNQPHSSGESKFSASFKHGQRATLFFYVLLTVQLGMILVNNHLDPQIFMYVYFYSLHVSGSHVPTIRSIFVITRHLVYVTLCRSVFLNRRAAARYRALASIIPGRERFS